jgi:hypothetical protein
MTLFTDIFSLIGYILALFGLGLIVGFSPTLYVTHIAVLLQAKHPLRQSMVLLGGVTTAVILLAALSEVIQPGVLRELTRDAVLAVTASKWLSYLLGMAFIAIGWYYLMPRADTPKKTKNAALGATSGLYTFGLIKTMASASGFAALLIGVRLINEASANLLAQLMLFAVFLTATILPFIGLLLLRLFRPSAFARVNQRLSKISTRSYRVYAGAVLILIGCALIVLEMIS